MKISCMLMFCAIAALAVRLHRLEQKTDKLGTNTGDAFAAVTRHLEKLHKVKI